MIKIDPRVAVLLAVGGVAALLIFWLEPSFTIRYVVVGVLGALYVFFRFSSWR